MKTINLLLLAAITLASCTQKQKDFANVTRGLSKHEVTTMVGEPDKKSDLLMAELWTYTAADRTVVFRADTVYDIITSANARMDSIENTLQETGQDIKEKLNNTADSIDSSSLKIKNKIMGDSTNRN